MKSSHYFKKIDPNTKVLIKQVLLGVVIISTVVLLLTAIWHGTRAQSLTITEVEVVGGETISHEQVRAAVQAQFEGEYVGFIPRRFAWFYPHDAIAQAVSEVERVESVEVSRTDGNAILVTFEEFLPDSLWCMSLTDNQCVFLDKTGYAYTQAPELDGGSFLRFVHLSDEPEAGRFLVEVADFVLLKQLADLLSDNNWQISHIEIDSARDAFLHVVDGGEFKVTLSQNPSVTVDNLMVVLTSPDFEDVRPGTFQYIDLRFGNKVFVNETPLVEESEAEATEEEGSEVATEPEVVEAAEVDTNSEPPEAEVEPEPEADPETEAE